MFPYLLIVVHSSSFPLLCQCHPVFIMHSVLYCPFDCSVPSSDSSQFIQCLIVQLLSQWHPAFHHSFSALLSTFYLISIQCFISHSTHCCIISVSVPTKVSSTVQCLIVYFLSPCHPEVSLSIQCLIVYQLSQSHQELHHALSVLLSTNCLSAIPVYTSCHVVLIKLLAVFNICTYSLNIQWRIGIATLSFGAILSSINRCLLGYIHPTVHITSHLSRNIVQVLYKLYTLQCSIYCTVFYCILCTLC